MRCPDYLPANASGRRGLLLVHGFVCNRGIRNAWWPRLLTQDSPVVALDLEPVFAPINHYAEQIDAAVERIEDKLLTSGAREVPSTRLGELVMRELKRIDKVAYVRFASVYRSFEDVDEFRQLIRDI